MEEKNESPCCDTPDCCDSGIPRRQFLKLAGFAAGSFALGKLPAFAGTPRFVPQDKAMPAAWRASLFARGSRSVYRGKDLRFIGMPVGGVCAGQVNLGGDGRLWLWDVFNEIKEGVVTKRVPYRGETFGPLGGANYIESPEQVHPFEQGFAIKVGDRVQPLDKRGWSDISFTGEYPIGFVEYRDAATPIQVSLESFSPFCPLDADDSGLPATIMRYTLRNTGSSAVKISIAGWIENVVGRKTVQPGEAVKRNRTARADGVLAVELGITPTPVDPRPARPTVVFEDFERPTYEGWTVTGTAFGTGPMERAKIPGYQGDVGGQGQRVVNTHQTRGGENVEAADRHVGRMTSPEFTVSRRYIELLLGGGNHPGRIAVNLLVDGKVVRTVTGFNSDQMRPVHLAVEEFEGKRARIELVDDERGGWGQLKVDHIVFTDAITQVPLGNRRDVGTMTIALLDGKSSDWSVHGMTAEPENRVFSAERSDSGEGISGIGRELTLGPGEAQTVSFVVAWHFPNLVINRLGSVGNHYGKRFASAFEVAGYVAKNFDRLRGNTAKWHATWYDSTLPYWLLDRTMGNTATLATMTCVRFGNGRFYGWEGVGCCDGTCGHVWQYAQTVGRLFPHLERTVREMVDFGVAFHEDSGLIDFRGEYGFGYAADAQAGYVLRAYREHQTSPNADFLRRIYPRAKKALEYLIQQDADDDGILEGRQHNTLDVDVYGPSSWLTSLYLAALRAGEEMAKEMNDPSFATRCRKLVASGTSRFNSLFWNGDYFIQRLNKQEQLEALRYGDGCEIDQAMGQGWAWQLGLDRVMPEPQTKKALKSLYRNNFLTSMDSYRDRYKPGRWYAMPDEAGLLMCTFPKANREEILGPKPTWASMYFNECWSGSEYEAAGHMIAEGLVEEGLAVTRAVHDRYHASRRNPWNEIECSDHYARCMAVYGVFVALSGFEYHGPRGHIGFAPRLRPENFRAAFTAAEGWGTFEQKSSANQMTAKIAVKHGKLSLQTLSLDVPPKIDGRVQVAVGSRKLPVTLVRDERRLVLTIVGDLVVGEGETLSVTIDA